MKWNVEQLQQRFAFRDQDADRDIRQLRKKATTNSTYKSIHDRQIGAQQVYIILTTTVALTSQDSFVAQLRSMKDAGPVQVTGAFDAGKVKLGWDETLDALLKEFSEP